MKLKIRKELCEMEKNSYASDQIVLPEGGIDCSEGCNPYGYPEGILQVARAFKSERFAPYPHSMAAYNGICAYWKSQCFLKRDNIMLTDGSISVIYIINNIFNVKGAKVLGIAPQFTDFGANIRLLGMEYVSVPLRRENNFQIDIEELLDKITGDLSLLYIDNPNNPTGQVVDSKDIERILKKAEDCGVCVIVDEAYGDFMPKDNSAVKFLASYENLIVIRTLSKGFGLAGLRVGYILAAENLIRCMYKMTNPYQVGEISRELAGAALTVENHIADHMENFARQKRELRENLGGELRMAETCDTVSICLIYHQDSKVDLHRRFIEEGVLTVPGAEFDELNSSYVRVRMPMEKDFPVLLKAVKKIGQE